MKLKYMLNLLSRCIFCVPFEVYRIDVHFLGVGLDVLLSKFLPSSFLCLQTEKMNYFRMNYRF